MDDDRILKSQANKLFEEIAEGFNPESFNIYDILEKSYKTNIIRFQKSDYFFNFGWLDNSEYRHVTFSPGLNTREQKGVCASWNALIDIFRTWLRFLSREINSVDLWETVKSGAYLTDNNIATIDNNPFNVEEKQKIQSELEDIKKYIISLQEFEEKEKQHIDEQFKYLHDASDRMGKKDWYNLTLGALIQIGLMFLTPENIKLALVYANNLFHMISSTLKGLGAG